MLPRNKEDLKKLRFVAVYWVDALAAEGWRTIAEANQWVEHDGSDCITIGLLYYSTDKKVVLVQSADRGNGTVSDMTEIPHCMIQCIIPLEEEGSNDILDKTEAP